MLTDLAYFSAQIASMTILVLLGLNFLLANPKSTNARLFFMICLSSTCYLIVGMQYKDNPAFRIDLGEYWLPFQILMNTGAGCWMILCFSIFQDTRRFPLWGLFAFALQLFLSALRPLFAPNELAVLDSMQLEIWQLYGFVYLPFLLQGAFTLLGLYWVIRDWQNDLLEARRKLRVAMVLLMSFFILLTLASEIALLQSSAPHRYVISAVNTYSVTLGLFVMALMCFRFKPHLDYLEPTIEAKTTGTTFTDEFNQELQRFEKQFIDGQAYLKPGLSISALAKQLQMPEYRLRQLINKQLGYRNFNALLNKYRVEEACRGLADPAKISLPILTIALSIGYQSIAPFNQAFKLLKGMTPSEYRKIAIVKAI